MGRRLCIWLGLVSGGFVGILLGLLHDLVCCTPPHPPPWSQLALDGLIVAVIAVIIASAFLCLVHRLPVLPVFLLGFLIAILTGVLPGPLAYHLPFPWLALFVCAILGALIGWIVCRIFCGEPQT